MTSRGPYEIGDYRTPEQLLQDLFPEFDDAGDPFDPVMWERAWDPRPPKLSVVVGGAGANRIGGPRAPVDTWPPHASTPPETLTRPAAALTSPDVSEPGAGPAGLA